MCDSDVYLPSASSADSFDIPYSSSKEEMEVWSTIQPYEGEPRESNEDFDQDWPSGFSRAVFRSRLEQKTPVIERLVCYVCVLFSMAMSMLRMGSCVSFNFLLT